MDQEHVSRLCAACAEKEYELFRQSCCHEFQDKNDVWFRKYKVDSYPHWDYDMDDSTLTFSGGAKADLVCQMQVVGTHHGTSWEWSWGNPNLPVACHSEMQKVKAFGESKGWNRLTTLFLDYDEFVGWECVADASHILNGIGVYRCGDENDAVWVAVVSCQLACSVEEARKTNG